MNCRRQSKQAGGNKSSWMPSLGCMTCAPPMSLIILHPFKSSCVLIFHCLATQDIGRDFHLDLYSLDDGGGNLIKSCRGTFLPFLIPITFQCQRLTTAPSAARRPSPVDRGSGLCATDTGASEETTGRNPGAVGGR
jgi:hypothetical protein